MLRSSWGCTRFCFDRGMRTLALTGRAGQRLELARAAGRANSTRITVGGGAAAAVGNASGVWRTIPGEIVAPAFGLRMSIRAVDAEGEGRAAEYGSSARLRNWRRETG